MKKMLIAIVMLASGCATQPLPSLDKYELMPAKDVFKYAAPAGGGNVVVARDAGFTGSAATFLVFIDGEKVMRIYGASKAYLQLPVGRHIFGLASAYENDPKPFVEVESEVTDKLSVFRVSMIPYQLPQINKTNLIK